MSQVWQAGPRHALTTDVVGLSSVMASSSRGGEDFAACMLGAVDLPVSIPLERWEVDAGTGASAEVVQSNMLRFAALADGVDSFDAAAFRLAPAEAAAMDPQQRILLEQTYGALQVLPYPASYSMQFSSPDLGHETSPFLRKDLIYDPLSHVLQYLPREPTISLEYWMQPCPKRTLSGHNEGPRVSFCTRMGLGCAGRQGKPGGDSGCVDGRVRGVRLAGVPGAAGARARGALRCRAHRLRHELHGRPRLLHLRPPGFAHSYHDPFPCTNVPYNLSSLKSILIKRA